MVEIIEGLAEHNMSAWSRFWRSLFTKILNFSLFQKWRSDRAERIVGILMGTEALDEINVCVARVADFGAGNGEIALEVARNTGAFIYCVDPYTRASNKVELENKGRIIWISEDAQKTAITSRCCKLVMGCYFLQVLDKDGKIKALEEMKRVTNDKIVIIDEVPRGGIAGCKDTILHYLLNLFGKGKYEIYSYENWTTLFKEAGLEMAGKATWFDRNSVIFILKEI